MGEWEIRVEIWMSNDVYKIKNNKIINKIFIFEKFVISHQKINEI